MNVVKGYKIKVHQAYSIHETGEYYTWDSWGANTDYYKATEVGVQVGIPDAWCVSESAGGSLLLYGPDEAIGHSLEEALELGMAWLVDAGEEE